MLFSIAFGVPEKSVFTRLFRVFATAMLANFQDRLVMTASICLHIEQWILYHNCMSLSILKVKEFVMMKCLFRRVVSPFVALAYNGVGEASP